ncbi:thioredoxin family protein, partial [uncultured Bilophila sp.]
VLPAPEPAPWEPFRPETFQSLLKKEPLLLDFTADWCPSCKFLEQTVLTPKRLRSLQERYGLRLIKVDLTRPDPEAQALLRALDSVSIPVTAIFPKGLLSNSPLVLRDLYTSGQLDQALSTLSPRK